MSRYDIYGQLADMLSQNLRINAYLSIQHDARIAVLRMLEEQGFRNPVSYNQMRTVFRRMRHDDAVWG